jgi:ABC-type transport system involved in cytochrome c biogenesis permease subunit
MDFASRISLVCFGASYAVGMVAELLRFLAPGKAMRWIATAAALAGLTAQTLFLAHRAVTREHLPISNQFESLLFVSWLIALVYLYLLLRDRRISAGIFILPVAIALILAAANDASQESAGKEQARSVIGAAHGLFILVGTVAIVVASLIAVMYLVKLRQLRHGVVMTAVRLPALERLDRLNRMAVYFSWPLLTIGLGLGLLLHQLRLNDPKVISTMIAWLILTILAHFRYRPEHRGQHVALLTIIAGVAVLVSLLGDPLFGTAHLQAQPEVRR